MSERNPKLEGVLGTFGRRLLLETRTHTMGTIVTFNGATRRATVRLDLLQVVTSDGSAARPGEGQATATRDAVILADVPVSMPGSTQGGIAWPIVPGDKVELHVQDRSLEKWLAQAGAEGAPAAYWTHALADSVAHPTAINAPGAVDATATVIDGAALVKIGAAASDFCALAALVLAELQAIKIYSDTHTHPTPSGPSSPPTVPMPAPASVAATKAQAE